MDDFAKELELDDDCGETAEFDDYDDDLSKKGYTADGCCLNSLGMELGLDGCGLTDDEKEVFCSYKGRYYQINKNPIS
ncbi:MAG: hypothetical protein PUB69_05200 [Desulfovibrionaceae bacterium]|nr:hypothetical protein [Desulfovibrionaceae bacterium]